MGITVEAQKNKNIEYVKNVKEICRIVIDRSSSVFKTNDFCYMLSRDYYKEQKTVEKLHKVTYSVIENRREKTLEQADRTVVNNNSSSSFRKKRLAFLDILLQSTDENGVPLSIEDIREEVDTFMFEVGFIRCFASSEVSLKRINKIMTYD